MSIITCSILFTVSTLTSHSGGFINERWRIRRSLRRTMTSRVVPEENSVCPVCSVCTSCGARRDARVACAPAARRSIEVRPLRTNHGHNAMCEDCAECALVEPECDACGRADTCRHPLRLCHVHDAWLWLCVGCAAWSEGPRACGSREHLHASVKQLYVAFDV